MKLVVRESRVFGSAITDHFAPSRSDLDFLVDFQNPVFRQSVNPTQPSLVCSLSCSNGTWTHPSHAP